MTGMNSIKPKTVEKMFRMTMVGAGVLLAATAVQAQSTNNVYLDFRAGVALPQSTGIKSSPYGSNGNVDFDAGPHLSVALGYRLDPSVAVELETGVLWNSVSGINGNNPSNIGGSADLYQIPVLVNFVFMPLHGAFSPFVGAGLGGVTTIFDSSNLPLFGPGTSYSGTDFVFAYQVSAGFKYAVSEHIDLGLTYQFLGTEENNWSDHGVAFQTDGVQTHSIMATLDWRF